MKKPVLPSADKCCGCSACYAACPQNAIIMHADEEGFLQPLVDLSKCVGCGKCTKSCPVINRDSSRKPLSVYGANAKNDDLRRGSSSGGIFTVLAMNVLSKGGIVFGAGFEKETWRVVHKRVSNLDELDDIRGSKYVQSDILDTFQEAKKALEAGTKVLYSGCPCQIAGLKKYLSKEYENLLTVDLICHGVPTPLAWQKYLETRVKENKGEIINVIARRFCRWREFPISLKFSSWDRSGNASYYSDRWHDPYMHAFVSFWNLRETCFKCRFRSFRSGADLTIGDYNNIAELYPEMDDDIGSSVIVVSSSKGRQVIEEIENLLIIHESCLEHVIKANESIVKSHKLPRARKLFLSKIRVCENFDDLVLECKAVRSGSLLMHIAWWLKRLLINHEVNTLNWR
jgi:coenzyme F420-reducing hydrogenase beta subunit